MAKYISNFWENKYVNNQTGWDIGYVSPPIKEYFDQIENKSVKVLVPGAGNAYEVEYLYKKGFKNIYLLDFAETAIKNFKKRAPYFPSNQIIQDDFFSHKCNYDIIVELAFLSSIKKFHREEYALKMFDLLSTNGKLIGLLFNHEFGNNFPPYGGTKKDYVKLFNPYFDIKTMDISYNSIKPRINRELFLNLIKKSI